MHLLIHPATSLDNFSFKPITVISHKKVDAHKLENFGETITPRSFAMKKSKFTEEQIAFALHQADKGTSVDEVCRKIGISQTTFHYYS
jgi:putative transposase